MSSSKFIGLPIYWWALFALILQNSGFAIVMRLSMIYSTPEDRYYSSTAVFVTEVLKLMISCLFSFWFDSNSSYIDFITNMKSELLFQQNDWFRLCIPSLLYTIQNSVQYMAMESLSAPVFQVLCQMKLITTAFFSVLILARRLLVTQWIAVVALTTGVAFVQLSQIKDKGFDTKENSWIGLLYVAIACINSGLAGVYLELILKSTKTSIWIRNIQLSVIGIILSWTSCFLKDGEAIEENGFFHGYNIFVLGAILLQAGGGMIVAIVVKYADNILKGFATSVSLLLSCLVSAFMLKDVDFNVTFYFGAIVVLAAVYLYGYSPSSLPTSQSASVLPLLSTDPNKE